LLNHLIASIKIVEAKITSKRFDISVFLISIIKKCAKLKKNIANTSPHIIFASKKK